MKTIASLAELHALYGEPSERSIKKVSTHLTPLYQQWISAARFLVLATVGDEGCDASPRGDKDELVKIADDKTIWLPDWRGNNRLDSLQNIVSDGRVSLMFMVKGSANVVRVIGTAQVSDDPAISGCFRRGTSYPKTVIVITVAEVYFQCAKAIRRSELWDPAGHPEDLPTAGHFIKEQDDDFDALTYDQEYDQRSSKTLW